MSIKIHPHIINQFLLQILRVEEIKRSLHDVYSEYILPYVWSSPQGIHAPKRGHEHPQVEHDARRPGKSTSLTFSIERLLEHLGNSMREDHIVTFFKIIQGKSDNPIIIVKLSATLSQMQLKLTPY